MTLNFLQAKVVHLLRIGKTVKEISVLTDCEQWTIDNNLRSLRKKIGASTNCQLIHLLDTVAAQKGVPVVKAGHSAQVPQRTQNQKTQ